MTNLTPVQTLYWRNYLARSRMHCTLCRFDGPNVGDPNMGNPPPGVTAPSLVLLPTPDCNPMRHGAAFANKQRAAFRRHVRDCHPEYESTIRWTL